MSDKSFQKEPQPNKHLPMKTLCLLPFVALVLLVTSTVNAQLYNTTLGVNTLSHNTTGNYNLAIGTNSLYQNTTGNDNTTNGLSCMYVNTTGSYNTAIGFAALLSNTTASNNSGFGLEALYSNTTGANNTASGAYTLFANQTGSNNVAAGFQALYSNSSGDSNTATGVQALYSSTTATQNTAMGFASLFANTLGFDCTAVGYKALFSNIGGVNNTACGWQALFSCTGSNNIAIGASSGSSITSGSHNIHIDNPGTGSDSGVIRIGQSAYETQCFISGIRGVTTGDNSAVPVLVDVNGQLGTTSSSRRYKEDIADMGDASARLLELRPVTFRYKKPYANGQKPVQYGLVAEEVEQAFPELAVVNKEGQPETVKYQDLTPMMLNELQKEHKRAVAQDGMIKTQQHDLSEQKKEIDEMKAQLAEMRRLLEDLSHRNTSAETPPAPAR
jgi:trimeric autotransporter adhesin